MKAVFQDGEGERRGGNNPNEPFSFCKKIAKLCGVKTALMTKKETSINYLTSYCNIFDPPPPPPV